MRRKNGTGSVVKLSGRRREPYEVRVNTRMDERNYPVYDVLGRYAERDDAMAALIEYNRNPYDIDSSKLTFAELYELWFGRKYNKSKRKYSQSSITCTRGAYNKCSALYDMPIHSKIAHMVANRRADGWYNITAQTFRVAFDNVLLQVGISDKHTPHDCRHTFVKSLNNTA